MHKPFNWGGDSARPRDEVDVGIECRFLGDAVLQVTSAAAAAVRLPFTAAECCISTRFFICLRSTSRGGLASELM